MRVEDLRPGQVAQLFVDSGKKTDLLRVTLRDVTPELPPGRQNVLMGDGIELYVVDAPTSETVHEVPVTAELTAELEHPQTGLVRIAVVGSATNAGRISAELVIEVEENPPATELAEGEISQDDLHEAAVTVPAGTERVVFELSWANHWGAYPTDDLDLYVVDPLGTVLFDGATSRSPERVVIDEPMPGVWGIGVSSLWGATVHGVHGGDAAHWTLRVTDQNGESL